MLQRNFIKRIFLVSILAIAIFCFITINQPSSAQSNLNLRSDIISLNSRISRLEQEVNRLRSFGRGLNPAPPKAKQPARPLNPNPTIINPPVVDGESIGRSDPLYERFATLLIELKEDVKNLDRRLSELETVNSQQSTVNSQQSTVNSQQHFFRKTSI